jgi:hypothetical protein
VGYGKLQIDGRTRATHRLVYEEVRGAIPDGLLLRHTCENRYAPGDISYRRCCNPSHLEPGTVQQNSDDMLAAGRHVAPRGEGHYNTRLTDENVREIRALYATGEWLQRELADKFGVNASYISELTSGRRR